MSGSSESRASTPGLLYRSVHNSHETTVLVVELIGKEFNGVASCDEGVLAVCKDGLFTVSSNKLSCSITVEPEGNKTAVKNISTVDFISAAGGRGFFAGVSDSGCIYTWGDQGEHGQLGHGACVQSASEPSMISHGSRFTSIHCGEAFSVALDDSGGVYSWGEVRFHVSFDFFHHAINAHISLSVPSFSKNFDRQLGLYTKRKQGMHLSNAMIEDMSFVPRLLPLSLQLKITKIACGMRFVLAIEQVPHNLFPINEK